MYLWVAALALSAAAEPISLVPTAVVGKATSDGQCRAPYRFDHKSATLQKTLERAIRKIGWQKLVDRKALSVALVDLSRPGKRYYAGINDNHMLYAASLPKIAILLSVVEAVQAGRIEWTHEFDRRLQNMIVASSNPDASWGTDLVGLLAIEKTLRDPRYCFYDNEHGGLWVGRAYRSGGASNRDPKYNISHGATARQVARYYAMLDAGRLVSRHWSFRMLGLMAPPKHFHKFVGALSGQTGVVFLARKSGTWRNYHSDSVLVQHLGWRYVLVGLSQTRDGEQIMRKLAVLADGIIQEGKHRPDKKPKVSRTSKKKKR
jgi:beta-lactamase class A